MILHFCLWIGVFIFVSKITKGRCGKTDYLIKIIIVLIFQIFISYISLFLFYTFLGIFWLPYVMLLFLCLNIYISTKRFNDSVLKENYIIFFSPILNLILFFGCQIIEIFLFLQPGHIYLILLIIANIIPIIKLYSKESDINIKGTDVPINYRKIFSKLRKNKKLIEINEDFIYIDDFQFSLNHNHNTHTILSYREVDDENLLIKYFKENNIRRLGFHYMNFYFELTDEEYNKMISVLKSSRNMIYIDYPFITVNHVNIFIRNDGMGYSVVMLRTDKEKLSYETNILRNISKIAENEKYISYNEIKKKDIIQWIDKCAGIYR